PEGRPMKRFLSRGRWLLSLGLVSAGLLVLARSWPGPAPGAAQPPDQGKRPDTERQEAGKAVKPAAPLRLRVGEHGGAGSAVLEPGAAAWDGTKPTRILLSRTPRVSRTEAVRALRVPALEVRALRSAGKLVLRLRWDDATRNAPAAPPRKTGTGGDPARL